MCVCVRTRIDNVPLLCNHRESHDRRNGRKTCKKRRTIDRPDNHNNTQSVNIVSVHYTRGGV